MNQSAAALHTGKKRKSFWYRLGYDLRTRTMLYLMMVPVLAYFFIFCYGPMYGVIIAFKNYSPGRGILGSRWVGLQNFRLFFNDVYFVRIFRNTLLLNFYTLLFGFPAPIILALMLNEVRNNAFKRTVQTITYMPHFISVMVVCGMIIDFVSLNGVVNDIVAAVGGTRVSMLTQAKYFRSIYVISGIWQEIGWGSIVYLAALTSIDSELYDAAMIDGANRWNQILHVTLPGIAPTIIIMFILRIGRMMNIGFEKILLLYNPGIYETADVISTYSYRKGLLDFNYSYSTTVGLFNSVVNFILVMLTNAISRRVNQMSLW